MKQYKTMKASDYKHIYTWGRFMQSYDYYIARQQALASEENAPATAIYKRNSGEWATADDVQDPDYHALHKRLHKN